MRGQQAVWVWGLLLAGFCAGCVSGAPTSDPPQEVQKYIVEAVPEGLTELNINFDNKITLAAVDLSPGSDVAPGKRVKLKMYWRVDKAIDESGWKLFTHVLDSAGDRLLNVDNVGPLRRMRRNGQAWPPSSWEAGKVYVDTQSFTMPRKVKGQSVQVVTGIWKGKQRLKIVGGPTGGKDRGLVATLKTGNAGGQRGQRVPRLDVAQLGKGERIVIDGKLDEPVWASAAATGAFVDVRTGKPEQKSPVQGDAKLAWDDEHLYVAVTVKDEDVVGGFEATQTDPHLWTKDCIELMIDPDGNGDNKDYYEIQVNPQNLVFDSRFDAYNQPRKEPDGPFGHQEWSSKLKSAVVVNGTLDKSGDKDTGYVVELQIPWASFGKAKASPPKPGDTWRVNLYAMQDGGGVAWSPILGQGNFHKASRFGRLAWATEKSPPSTMAAADKTGAGASPLSVSRKALEASPAAGKVK